MSKRRCSRSPTATSSSPRDARRLADRQGDREAWRGSAPRRLPGRRLRRSAGAMIAAGAHTDRQGAAPRQPRHDGRLRASEGQLRHADRARPGVSPNREPPPRGRPVGHGRHARRHRAVLDRTPSTSWSSRTATCGPTTRARAGRVRPARQRPPTSPSTAGSRSSRTRSSTACSTASSPSVQVAYAVASGARGCWPSSTRRACRARSSRCRGAGSSIRSSPAAAGLVPGDRHRRRRAPAASRTPSRT